MSAYPEKHKLKKLYPEVGCKFLREENNLVFGYQTNNRKPLPYVLWRASSLDEVEHLILRVHHWERTGKRLKPPLDIPNDSVVMREVKETLPDTPTKHGVANTGSKWMHNNVTAERIRVKADQIDEYLQKGFVIGKNFTAYVDPAKAERVALERKTEYLANLKDAYYARKKAG